MTDDDDDDDDNQNNRLECHEKDIKNVKEGFH